jgi:hypothetical protein
VNSVPELDWYRPPADIAALEEPDPQASARGILLGLVIALIVDALIVVALVALL